MMKIKFSFDGANETMEGQKDDTIIKVLSRYAKKIDKKIEDLYFLYNGDIVREKKKFKDICGNQEEIVFLVFEYENGKNADILKQSKNIICPICKEICMINFKDYKITFNNCKNNHRFSNILFNEFEKFQKINESKITCNKCGEKKSETNCNKFYKCFDCNIDLCPIHYQSHGNENKNHLIIDYDIKNCFCYKHGQRYIFHCEHCNKD